jgi:hypothetical protein
VSMRVPWLPRARAWQLQNQPRPPVMPFLHNRSAQAEACANLAAAVASSPAAAEVERSWNALTTNDERRLYAANVAMDKARYPEPDDVRGDEDFRQLAWSDYILDDALYSLPERARAFTDALASADSLLQQAAVLFSQLIMTGEIRQLPHVGYVDQFDGPDHWHTVRSDSYIYEPIRVREIIGFDHPYPRGLMLVEGITEQLPFEPRSGSVTVRGPILPGSEEIAVSAVRIQRVFVAPPGGAREHSAAEPAQPLMPRVRAWWLSPSLLADTGQVLMIAVGACQRRSRKAGPPTSRRQNRHLRRTPATGALSRFCELVSRGE